MNPRQTARIVGVLFITATASYMLGNGYLEPVLTDTDYLVSVYANQNKVLFIFNSTWGLITDIIDHSVYSLYLVDDSCSNFF